MNSNNSIAIKLLVGPKPDGSLMIMRWLYDEGILPVIRDGEWKNKRLSNLAELIIFNDMSRKFVTGKHEEYRGRRPAVNNWID